MTNKEISNYPIMILEILTDFYREDPQLIEKYHQLAGSSLKDCVLKTSSTISKPGIKFYLVYDGEERMGYYTEEYLEGHRFVMSFFIRPPFRNKENSIRFWEHISAAGDFYTSISEKNTRAAIHLVKNGFQFVGASQYAGLKWELLKKIKK